MEVTKGVYAKESEGWASFDADVEIELDHEPVRYEHHHSPNKRLEVVKGLAAQDELQQDATDTTFDTRIMDHSLITEDTHEDNEKRQTKSRRPRWLMLSLVVLVVLILIALVVVLVLLFVTKDNNSGDSSSPVEGPPAENDRRCNGLESNCKLRVNDLMYATVNDAMSSQQDGFQPFNQLEQLEVRRGEEVCCRTQGFRHPS
jgi:hypothetical protein